MRAPDGAIHELDLSPSVALYDVSHLLPKGEGHYKTRSVVFVNCLYVHKSGADGPPGFKGAEGMARYCTKVRHWPGAPYTFWISRAPDEDLEGRFLVYRCQRDSVRSYHTGGTANELGIAVALQGNYDSEWDLLSSGFPKITREPTDAQILCLEALVNWAIQRYRLKLPAGLSGHWEAPKPKRVCPGDYLRQWVISRRANVGSFAESGTVAIPVVEPGEVDVSRPSPETLQRALALVGFSPGDIDGVWGYRSRAALERFQRVHELEADGSYGPITAAALLESLRVKGVSRLNDFKRFELPETTQ